MAGKRVNIRIITPEKIKADEMADMVIMRCTTGDMGIMAGHEARSAVLDHGALRIINKELDGERIFAIYGGLVEVEGDAITILAHGADLAEDIDRARAEADRDLAEKRLQEDQDDLQIKRDQAMLRRALVQIEVSSYPFISSKSEKK